MLISGFKSFEQRSRLGRQQSRLDHAEDAADGAFRGHGRRLVACLGAPPVDHVRELIEHLRAQQQRGGARGGGLRHTDSRELRLLVEQPEQRREARPHTVHPALVGEVGGSCSLFGDREGLLDRRQEAVAAVVEQLVEGPPRHARHADHVGDGGHVCALLGGEIRRR